MKPTEMKMDLNVDDTVQTRAYLPYGSQQFIAPGTVGTIREKNDNGNYYTIEFENGVRADANGDMVIPANKVSGSGSEENPDE